MRETVVAVVAWLLAAPLLAQPLTKPSPIAGGAEVRSAPTPAPDVRLWPSPRIRAGRSFTIELTTKLQGDLSRFDPVVDADDEDFVWRRRRVGVKGELFSRVSFEVEREFGDEDNPWRDVYLNVRAHDLLEARGGKFRIPFSLDNLTGSTSHDFVYRSLGARTLGFGRDLGLMLHGRTDGRRLTYAVGVFDGDAPRDVGDGFFDDDEAGLSANRTLAGRLTVQPFDTLRSLPRGLRNLEFGGSLAGSDVPEGLNGFRGRSVYRYDFFAPVYVKGRRLRAGLDLALLAGPGSLKAEWIGTWDERRSQGLGDVDLPSAFGRGWYVAGTWLVTGEDKEDNLRPRRPFLQGGIGALEAAARYERLTFGSTVDDGEPAFANPRAANLLRNTDAITTVGVTWHLNRWFRLQGNAIRETFDDVERAPISGRASYWSYVGRVQFAL